MANFQKESLLVEDVYLHSPISSDLDAAAVVDARGDLQIFTIGTDGHIYNLSADGSSDTGWRQQDLGPPNSNRPDLIAAGRTPDGHLVVCVADAADAMVCVREQLDDSSWRPWRQIPIGVPQTGPMTFYQLELRANASGALEFLLLHFVRNNRDPDWPYFYRVGRATLDAPHWSVAMQVGPMTGPSPTRLPTMTLTSSQGSPALALYWPERRIVRVWRNLDSGPQPSDVATLPNAGDALVRLFSHNDLVVGIGTVGGQSGLFRLDEAAHQFVAVVLGPVAVDADIAPDATGGYHVMVVDAADDVSHVFIRADGTAFSAFSSVDDHIRTVTGCNVPGQGALFLATTDARGLYRFIRTGEAHDWLTEEVDVQTSSGDRVVWYTSIVTAIDDAKAGIPNASLRVVCAEATELLVNGVSRLVGPGRPGTFEADSMGRLVIQQRTDELDNLWVPDLEISVAEPLDGDIPEALSAYAAVRDRLYALTPEQLVEAHGRDPSKPVLPAEFRDQAVLIAAEVSLTMSLGRAVLHPELFHAVTEAELGQLTSGRVRFTPAGSASPTFLDIDPADFFEAIKDFVVDVVDVVLSPIIDVGTGLVMAMRAAIRSAAGLFEVIVDSLELAFDALRTVFERFRVLIQEALEWLARLFDWQRIKEWQAKIRGTINDSIAKLPAALASSGLEADIDRIFNQMRAKVGDAFGFVRQQVGSQPIGADIQGAGFTNFSSLFNLGGTSLDTPANWLLNKVLSELPGLGLSPAMSGPGWSEVAAIGDSVETGIVGGVWQALDNLKNLFSSLSIESFLSTALDTLLDQIQSLIDGVLALLQSVGRAVVGAMSTLCSGGALTTLLNTQMEIPLIGWVLRLVGIDPTFSIIDLVSLLIAIPTHIVTSFIGTNENENDPPGIDCEKSYLYGSIGMVIYTAVAAFADSPFAQSAGRTGLATGIGCLANVIAVAICIIGLANWSSLTIEGQIGFIAYAVIQLVLLVMALKGGLNDRVAKLTGFTGIVMLALAIIYIFRASPQPTPATMFGALLVTVPDIFHLLDLGYPSGGKPPPLCLKQMKIDIMCFGVTAAAGFIDYGGCKAKAARLIGDSIAGPSIAKIPSPSW